MTTTKPTINPIARFAVSTTALLLHERGLEREWVARVIAAAQQIEQLLERETPLSPVEIRTLNEVWDTLATEAKEKLATHRLELKGQKA